MSGRFDCAPRQVAGTVSSARTAQVRSARSGDEDAAGFADEDSGVRGGSGDGARDRGDRAGADPEGGLPGDGGGDGHVAGGCVGVAVVVGTLLVLARVALRVVGLARPLAGIGLRI